jgi:hypothetical protein
MISLAVLTSQGTVPLISQQSPSAGLAQYLFSAVPARLARYASDNEHKIRVWSRITTANEPRAVTFAG